MSLFPYADILTKEIESWKSYSDCLRKKDRELFDQMLKKCYQYLPSINAKGKDFSTESLLITLLFEQYKKQQQLLSLSSLQSTSIKKFYKYNDLTME